MIKVIHIVPGSGGTFYCQNCLRDSALILALRALNLDVLLAPMYLPMLTDNEEILEPGPVFYGAINTYVREKFPILRKLPNWVQRALDAPFLLRLAAKRANATRARGLEDMTMSVLRGENGNQAQALEALIEWIKDDNEDPPDLIHISNALLLGLVPRIKDEIGVPVLCSLQDEDTWVATMQPDSIKEVWNTMTGLTAGVTAFTAVSEYYAEKMMRLMHIPEEKMHVVPIGIEVEHYSPPCEPPDPPTIGYLSKMSDQYGLDILIDAFLILKKDEQFRRLRLRATGGMTDDVQDFLTKMRDRLGEHQILSDVDFVSSFARADRIKFLQSLTALSVPVPGGEAFGIYQLEAMACGVPVVQPEEGAFPEIVEDTGGGITYAPNTPQKLAEKLREVLLDAERRNFLGDAGRKAVNERYAITHMAKKMSDIYAKIAKRRKSE